MTTYTLAAASREETGTLVCMCGALPRFSLSPLPPPTHTHIYINTHDHPLRPQEKHCPVIIRHFLHARTHEKTNNVYFCVRQVVLLLTVERNFFTPTSNSWMGDKCGQKSGSHFFLSTLSLTPKTY